MNLKHALRVGFTLLAIIGAIGATVYFWSAASSNDLAGWSKRAVTKMAITLIIVCLGGGTTIYFWSKKKYAAESPRSQAANGRVLIGIGVGITTIWIVVGVAKWWDTHPNSTSSSEVSAINPPAERSAVTSRVTTKTIIAKPEVYSETVSIPHGQWFRIRSEEGCTETKTAAGKIYRGCPGEHYSHGENIGLRDGTFSFRSLEDKEVIVIVEWEPK